MQPRFALRAFPFHTLFYSALLLLHGSSYAQVSSPSSPETPPTIRVSSQFVMLDALIETRKVLDTAGVPYRSRRVFGHCAKTIAAHAAQMKSDVVLIDASHFGFFRRLMMFASLWRLTTTPVTMLH